MSITLQWLGHASFCISSDFATIYIDPWKITCSPQDASHVLISHSHHDHYSSEDIAKVAPNNADIIGAHDAIEAHGRGLILEPGQQRSFNAFELTGTPAYNVNKSFHPRNNHWLGFLIEIDHHRIYYAGDTDHIPEMADLARIDLALLPVGGTYTMDPREAAAAAHDFKPNAAIPYHWGDIIGSVRDAQLFASLAPCPTHILQPSDTLSL